VDKVFSKCEERINSIKVKSGFIISLEAKWEKRRTHNFKNILKV